VVDRNGHIDLIKAAPEHARPVQRDRGEEAAQGAMGLRLADAAGRQSGSAKPWYSSTSADGGYAHGSVSKDAWGNEDPRRAQRDQQRTDANDPLASMRKGVKQLRDAEGRRRAWMDQRERDLNEVEELARRERKRRRRKERSTSLDGFDLDKGYRDDHRNREKVERHHHGRRRRGRSRSPRRDTH
jgi:hypothetical protein